MPNNDLKFNIPKNHSVMDLNKLNKITNQTLTNKKVQKKTDSFYFKSKENENKILDANKEKNVDNNQSTDNFSKKKERLLLLLFILL